MGEASIRLFERAGMRIFFLSTITCIYILIAMQYLPYSTNSRKSNSLGLLKPLDFTLKDVKISSQNQHLETNEIGDHPYLSQRCFVYRNFTAKFNCTQSRPYKKYTNELIMKCASKSWELFKDKNAPDPWHSLTNSSTSSIVNSRVIHERPAIRWVMIGDSHIRWIFDVLLKRIVATGRVKYWASNFKEDEWRDARLLDVHRRETAHQPMHEVIHLDAPLKILYYWDPLLERLPKLIEQWEAGDSKTRPTHLLIGATLHFMKNTSVIYSTKGPKEASELFAKRLRVIAPLLESFSKTTPTIYKLQDHLQKDPMINAISNWNNINLYNQIVVEEIPKSKNLATWNSAIPLSDQYNEECRLRFKRTETKEWTCHDKRHIGYIMIEQYADMYLNDMCNGVV